MTERFHNGMTPTPTTVSLPLAERLDPAIGEATSGIGAMLTELIRRTLRSGVQKVDEEIQGLVAEKVDLVIADRTPALAQTAAEVAEDTARTTASKIAGEEVKTLESKTAETANDLARQIAEAERRALTTASETAKELAQQIEETAKRAEATTAETANDLAKQIEEAEGRVSETTRAAITEQIQDLVKAARRSSARSREHLKTLDLKTAGLADQLEHERNARKALQDVLKTEWQQRMTDIYKKMASEEAKRRRLTRALRDALVKNLSEMQVKLIEQVQSLQHANRALAARVAELEKPHGVKALFAKWFPGRQT